MWMLLHLLDAARWYVEGAARLVADSPDAVRSKCDLLDEQLIKHTSQLAV